MFSLGKQTQVRSCFRIRGHRDLYGAALVKQGWREESRVAAFRAAPSPQAQCQCQRVECMFYCRGLQALEAAAWVSSARGLSLVHRYLLEDASQ